jgi:hypothetical protein
MGRGEYVEYKLAIAEEFYALVGGKILSVKPLHTYVANMLDLDSGKEYRVVMLGDGEILRVLSLEEIGGVNVGEGRVVCVYLNEEELRKLAEISRENGQSISKTVREAVSVFLSFCVEPATHTFGRSLDKKLK